MYDYQINIYDEHEAIQKDMGIEEIIDVEPIYSHELIEQEE